MKGATRSLPLLVCALAFAALLLGQGRAEAAGSPEALPSLNAGVSCLVQGPDAGGGAERDAQEPPHHAGLLVVFGDGRTERLCIAFEEEEISGEELLRRSGLSVVFSGFGGLGAAVCRIEDTGCADPNECWCQCRGGRCDTWRYYGLADRAWRFQQVGPSTRRLRDGDADAWVWGAGEEPPGRADSVCPVVTAEPPSVVSPTPGASIVEPTAPIAARPTLPAQAAEETDTQETAGTPAPASTGRVVSDPAEANEARTADGAASANPGSGPPAGLIAFGAVVGALAAGTGALALRRRRRG